MSNPSGEARGSNEGPTIDNDGEPVPERLTDRGALATATDSASSTEAEDSALATSGNTGRMILGLGDTIGTTGNTTTTSNTNTGMPLSSSSQKRLPDEDMRDAGNDDLAGNLRAEEEDDDDDEEDGDETGEEALKGLIQLHKRTDDIAAATATEEEEEDSSKEGAVLDDAKEKQQTDDSATPIVATKQPPANNSTEISSYSTRGRAQVENALDRLAAVGDLLSIGQQQQQPAGVGVPKKSSTLVPTSSSSILGLRETALPPASSANARMRESFLSDSLTEEERRTRTRFLPDVEGMHALRKQEIKSDLALARSILGASGTTERLKTNKRSSNNSRQAETDDSNNSAAMDLESATQSGEDAVMSEEDRALQAGSRTIEIGSTVLNLPSLAFVAPVSENVGGSGTTGSNKRSTPREVEAVTAFNPPRPPESIGAKKKHRMLRWERRPADIEADLSSYHKTVQRTREELKNAKDECERIKAVDNQLRRHFLQHIKCMNEELARLGGEIAIVQQECVDLADLPSSRSTRTRGSTKGNVTVMRDVIQMLRSKGKDIEARGLAFSSPTLTQPCIGLGGVTPESFLDWEHTTAMTPNPKMALGWIVPGDRVQTPYGEGSVVSVLGAGAVSVDGGTGRRPEATVETSNDDSMEIDGAERTLQPTEAASGKTKVFNRDTARNEPDVKTYALTPRVGVQLSFGTAFFSLESVTPLNDVAVYTDEQMAKRWTGIAETAMSQGSSLDVNAMTHMIVETEKCDRPEQLMDIEPVTERKVEDLKRRLVPFGSSLFPTAIGRGTLLHKASLSELDETVSKAFFTGNGVLGMRDNSGVPADVRKLEDARQEHLILQAKVLQLRNQLYRQRRIRMLNEKTHIASQERATRVESLVAEMRLDLKSLKGRLDLEIRDLGINEFQAESILKAYYMSLDSQHSGEASPPKRLRRMSRADGDDEKGDVGEGVGDTVTELPLRANTEESTIGIKL